MAKDDDKKSGKKPTNEEKKKERRAQHKAARHEIRKARAEGTTITGPSITTVTAALRNLAIESERKKPSRKERIERQQRLVLKPGMAEKARELRRKAVKRREARFTHYKSTSEDESEDESEEEEDVKMEDICGGKGKDGGSGDGFGGGGAGGGDSGGAVRDVAVVR